MNKQECIDYIISSITEDNDKTIKIKITLPIDGSNRIFFYLITKDTLYYIKEYGPAFALLIWEESTIEILNTDRHDDLRILTSNAYKESEPKLLTLLRIIFYKAFESTNEKICDDRSGLFDTKNGVPFPSTLHTDKTMTEIIDERALEFANLNPLVMWSGGIDSNAMVTSFIKNNINFRVAYYGKSFNYFAKNLKDVISSHCETIDISTYTREQVDELNQYPYIVTGDCADQLFPCMQHSLDPEKIPFKYRITDTNGVIDQYYKEELPDNIKFMSAKEWLVKSFIDFYRTDYGTAESFYNDYLLPKIANAPIDIQYGYQLKWFLKFIFKYEQNSKKPNSIAFYNTDSFQQWAFTNLNNNYNTGSASYLTYKQPLKDYAYSVLNDENILQQHKTHE